MRKTYIILCLSLACMTTFTACKKTTTTSTPSSNAPSVATPSDADGALVAIKVSSTQTVGGYTIPIEIGTAAAWFGLSGAHQNAGNVTVDSKALTNQSNSYIYQPTQADPTGLDFNNSVAWDVTGNSANSIPPFSYNDVSSFPSVSDISAASTVPTSGSYTLTASSSVYGDSVVFVITGSQKSISFIAGPNTSSHTFTASEMATVGATGNNSGLLQIAPYSLNRQVIGGKKYYFIKETCVSKFVTLN